MYRLRRDKLDAISDPVERDNKFVELNVMEQVCNLSKTSLLFK